MTIESDSFNQESSRVLADLPGNIDFQGAQLPGVYLAAQRALENAERLDEVLDWADKSAAIASYARQVDDRTLENMARRIRVRAFRRLGEMLLEFDGRGGHMKKGATPPSRRDVAAAAGISLDQQKSAVSIAKIPEPLFIEVIEREVPPTVPQMVKLHVVGYREQDSHGWPSKHPRVLLKRVIAKEVVSSLRKLSSSLELTDCDALSAAILADESAAAECRKVLAVLAQVKTLLDKGAAVTKIAIRSRARRTH